MGDPWCYHSNANAKVASSKHGLVCRILITYLNLARVCLTTETSICSLDLVKRSVIGPETELFNHINVKWGKTINMTWTTLRRYFPFKPAEGQRQIWLAGRKGKGQHVRSLIHPDFFFLDVLQLNVSSDGTCPELASLLPQGYLLLLAGKPRPFRAHWLWCLKELH